MAILKQKQVNQMRAKEIEEKMKELNLELLKARGQVGQGGSNKIREIKRTIARLKTQKNKMEKEKNGN